MSKPLDEAKGMLPERLHSLLLSMIAEYKFACLKHHGFEMVSPKVIAELILNRWYSDPVPFAPPISLEGQSVIKWCTCGLRDGERTYCKREQCGLDDSNLTSKAA